MNKRKTRKHAGSEELINCYILHMCRREKLHKLKGKKVLLKNR